MFRKISLSLTVRCRRGRDVGHAGAPGGPGPVREPGPGRLGREGQGLLPDARQQRRVRGRHVQDRPGAGRPEGRRPQHRRLQPVDGDLDSDLRRHGRELDRQGGQGRRAGALARRLDPVPGRDVRHGRRAAGEQLRRRGRRHRRLQLLDRLPHQRGFGERHPARPEPGLHRRRVHQDQRRGPRAPRGPELRRHAERDLAAHHRRGQLPASTTPTCSNGGNGTVRSLHAVGGRQHRLRRRRVLLRERHRRSATSATASPASARPTARSTRGPSRSRTIIDDAQSHKPGPNMLWKMVLYPASNPTTIIGAFGRVPNYVQAFRLDNGNTGTSLCRDRHQRQRRVDVAVARWHPTVHRRPLRHGRPGPAVLRPVGARPVQPQPGERERRTATGSRR